MFTSGHLSIQRLRTFVCVGRKNLEQLEQGSNKCNFLGDQEQSIESLELNQNVALDAQSVEPLLTNPCLELDTCTLVFGGDMGYTGG